ncbi:PIR Superfamily Protein [Plasmodium ovale wallikeri]|uniref:Plasmodium vivax Vir protein, putative n=2 Tax=Plasmodium ovale TaxID=36330 RepID=A0A1C3KH03_PLAOA|nr:PIR Superfamily Protein [Plasmodium ovale wallikeri]SBT73016.1 Plasmodium vivax Vir protein, putative [Plasmodium ovale]
MGTEEDSEVSGLPSKIFYSKLDADKENYSHLEQPSWYFFVKSHAINKLSIFSALLQAFYYVTFYGIRDSIFNAECWNYLYFWVGLKALDELGESAFVQVMPVVKAVRSAIDRNDEYNDMFKITKDHFRDLKEIYDYFQNYRSINARIGPHNNDCTLAFKQYVEKGYKSYNAMKGKCSGNHKDDHCKIFHRFVSKYEMENVKELTCNGTKVTQPQDRMDYTVDVQDSRRQLPSREGQSHDGSLTHGGLPSSPGSTNAMSTVLPLLGTFSMFFIWFKFSPLGSWLYNEMFKKKIIRNYEQEEEQEILENPYAFPHGNVGDSMHHIAYHTT